jgi:hypothetical protein
MHPVPNHTASKTGRKGFEYSTATNLTLAPLKILNNLRGLFVLGGKFFFAHFASLYSTHLAVQILSLFRARGVLKIANLRAFTPCPY